MAHRRVVLGFTTAAALLVLSGCAPQGPRLITDGIDLFAVVAAPSDFAFDALVTGNLAVDDNGCFAVEADDGATENVLWASGTSIEGNRLTIAGIDHSLGEGALFSMGGGEIPADSDQAPCWEKGDPIWVMAPDSGTEGAR